MSNPWFRLYSEFAHDPKVQMMSEAMQRRLVMLFCLRCSNALVTLHVTEIAFHLRVTEDELEETRRLFVAKGFIDDDWNIENWDKRQFKSDSSAPRVAKHRANKKETSNANVTLQQQPSNALDTEQIQITDTEQKKKPKSAPATPLPDWLQVGSWNDYLENRKQLKAPMTDRAKLLAIAKLSELRQSGHDPTAVLNQSIYNGWKGLFPIKADIATEKGQTRHEQLADKLADLTGARRTQPCDQRVIHGTAERLD